MSTACFQGSLLTNCERQNFVSRDDKMIIKNNRASIERSGYFHFDNDFRSVLFDAERSEMEFIFRNCLRNPVLNSFLSMQRLCLIVHNRIVREAGKNRLHIMPVARIDILLN